MSGPKADTDDDAPDLRHNHLRDRLTKAATTASDARTDLGGQYGNPLTDIANAIEGAWTAEGSVTRKNFIEDVRGAGTSILKAFDGQHDRLQGDVGHEPVQIDIEAHPDLEWKTTEAGVDARASMRSHY